MNRIENRDLAFNFSLTIDEVLNVNDDIQQKVSEIIDFHGISIEKNEDNFLIGKTFKKLFCNCLGFKPCHELLGVMDSSKEEFKDFITNYDVLSSLFLDSFKNHIIALDYFGKSEQKAKAIAVMAKTGEIAKIVSTEYKLLSQKFLNLREKVCEIAKALSHQEFQLYEKLRNEDPYKAIIESGLKPLEKAKKYASRLSVKLLNIGYYFEKLKIVCDHLTDPAVGNECLYVEMDSSVRQSLYKEVIPKFVAFDNAYEKDQRLKSINTLDDFIITAGKKQKEPPCSKETVSFIKSISHIFGGIEERLNQSYLEWLALAKINQIMVKVTEEALEDVNNGSNEVLRLQEDPLVRALLH